MVLYGWGDATVPVDHFKGSEVTRLQGLRRIPWYEIYDFDDLDDDDRDEAEPIVRREFDKSVCVATVISAAFHLADASIDAVAASKDCPEGHTDDPEASAAVLSAQSALGDVERLVNAARASLHNSTASLPPLQQLKWRMSHAVPQALLAGASKKLDEAQVSLDVEEYQSAEVDLYSKKREAQVKCARDSLFIARALAAASARLSTASGACPEDQSHRSQSRCAAQLSASVQLTAQVGSDIDRMVLVCRPDTSLLACARRLEGLSWQIAAAAKFYSGSIRACSGHNPERLKANYVRDFGWCIGEIFSTMGYIGTSSLYVVQAAQFDCKAMQKIIDDIGNGTTTPLQLRALQIARGECAGSSVAFIRTIFLGAVKAWRSAAHCGDLSERCPRDIMRSISAFAGVAQATSYIYEKCSVPANFSEDPKMASTRNPDCVQEIGGMVKMLGIATSFLADSTGSCVGTRFAKTRCGASVLRGLAGLGALVETAANTHRECYVLEDYFRCGKNQRWMAESLRVFILAISTAVLNCGLSPMAERWKATPPVAMPRFFTFP